MKSITGWLLSFLRIPPDSLVHNRHFLRVWISSTIAVLGSSVSQLALPLAAVQILHATPLEMGLLFACGALPFVFFSLPAGVWLDRCNKRGLIVAFNLLGGLALASVPLAAALDFLSLPLLCSVEFLVGTSFCVGGSAQQIFVTLVVGRDRLLEANSKQAAASSVAGLLGPILAGMLVGAFGAPIAVTLDALMFFTSAAFIASVRLREPPLAARRASIIADALVGLRFVWNHRLLRAFAVMAAMCILLHDGFMVLYVLHATRSLALTPGQLAAVSTQAALGALCGAMLAPKLSRRIGRYALLPLGLAVAAVGFFGYSLVPAGPAAVLLAGITLFLVDAGMTAYTVNYLALRQLATPDALLGRMTTTMRFLSVSAAPVGSALSGYCASRYGIAPVLACLGLGGLLAAFLAHFLIARALPTLVSDRATDDNTAHPREKTPQETA